MIARYHTHSGNLNFVDTIRDLYGKSQLKAIPDLASNLNAIYENLKVFNYLPQEELLEKHTMYLYYTNFTNSKIKEQTKQIILYESNKSKVYRILGILGNKIKEHKFFRICNKCLEEDFQKYGENYWHLIHQLPSVFYCHKHPDEILLDSKIWYRKGSRIEFKSASLMGNGVQNSSELKLFEKNKGILKRITKESVKIATQRYDWDLENIHEVYRVMLNTKGYLSAKGTVNQTKLGRDLLEYYIEELLVYLNCELKIGDNNCWLRLITSKHRGIFHSLKYILLLVFLNKTLDDIEKLKCERYLPFGTGKYPCLNPAVEHYKQRVISSVAITTCTDTRKPVGTFSCDCGFVYSRRGPDIDKADKFKVGRIKSFGPVWQAKLMQLATSELSPYQIAQLLDCDYATVKKYMTNLKDKSSNNNEPLMDLRIRKETEWLNLIEKYPDFTITQLREMNPALYAWHYRNNSDWLKENSPRMTEKVTANNRVDWEKRDLEILHLVKKAIQKLYAVEKPVYVNKSRVAKEIGQLSLLEKRLDKLPKTKAYLDRYLETREQIQIRRIKWACRKLFMKDENNIAAWKVRRLAG